MKVIAYRKSDNKTFRKAPFFSVEDAVQAITLFGLNPRDFDYHCYPA